MRVLIVLVIGLMGPVSMVIAADSTPPCNEGRSHERGAGRR